MTSIGFRMAIAAGACLAATVASAQFSSGSNGSFGPINVTGANETIALPPDGIIHATTVTISGSRTLTFTPNALNTPVVILAQGDVIIGVGGAGVLDVSGTGGSNVTPFVGRGGPGGFDGGVPGFAGGIAPGSGHGPGGGLGGDIAGGTIVGSGVFGGPATRPSARDGRQYGNPLLLTMVGGSGGGGTSAGAAAGGGGGGGSILIASSTRIEIGSSGVIRAKGGNVSGIGSIGGDGSGGSIRLVAPQVVGSGDLDVRSNGGGGPGRVRVDTLDQPAMDLDALPAAAMTVGSLMQVFPAVAGRLDVIEAAGQAIPEGATAPVLVNLPAGSASNRAIVVQARDFTGPVDIEVVLVPDSGDRIVATGTIDMNTNPDTVSVNVSFPINTATRVEVYQR